MARTALFNKLGEIKIPESKESTKGLFDFESVTGRIVWGKNRLISEEKNGRIRRTEVRLFLIETGQNGSTSRETFFCPCDVLGRFKESSLTDELVTITPHSMTWSSREKICRIDKNGATLRRVRQRERSEKTECRSNFGFANQKRRSMDRCR